jgi:hypothetical protein
MNFRVFFEMMSRVAGPTQSFKILWRVVPEVLIDMVNHLCPLPTLRTGSGHWWFDLSSSPVPGCFSRTITDEGMLITVEMTARWLWNFLDATSHIPALH